MIEKFRIKQFCCCCSIRTGSLVIGALGWMGSLLQAMTFSETRTQTIEATGTGDTAIIVEHESGPSATTILGCLFMFGLSAALVVGVYRENRRFILPWLIIKFLECCVLTIITVVIFFMLFVSEPAFVEVLAWLFVTIGLLGALLWYAWICVWSLYMDMGEPTTLTYVPTVPQSQSYEYGGQSFPMTQPPMQQYPQYPVMETKPPTSPPQEMV